jgi:hypothetical protein
LGLTNPASLAIASWVLRGLSSRIRFSRYLGRRVSEKGFDGGLITFDTYNSSAKIAADLVIASRSVGFLI